MLVLPINLWLFLDSAAETSFAGIIPCTVLRILPTVALGKFQVELSLPFPLSFINVTLYTVNTTAVC